MSNSFGFENSAPWGSAGLAIGLGIIEEHQREQRHREIVYAIENNGRGHDMDAEIELILAKHQLELMSARIDEMQKLLDMYRGLDAERVQEIEKLEALRRSNGDAARKLVVSLDEVIDRQTRLLEARGDTVKVKDRQLSEKNKEISDMKKTISRLEQETKMSDGIDYFTAPRLKKSETVKSCIKSLSPK